MSLTKFQVIDYIYWEGMKKQMRFFIDNLGSMYKREFEHFIDALIAFCDLR